MAETTPLPIKPEATAPEPESMASSTVVQLPAKPTAVDPPKSETPPPFPPYPYFHPGFPPFPPAPVPEGYVPPHPYYPPHPAYMGYYYPPPHYPPALQAPLPPLAPTPVAATPPKLPADLAATQHNQRLLVLGIIAAVFLVHLPWLTYLFAMHGCWGGFLDLCFATKPAGDDGLDQTFLFARVAFFILQVQSTLAVDFQQFSQVMQIGTGLGSFALTKIVAANGTVVQGTWQRYGLAATCAVAFVVLFWAELTLTSTANYPILGDETVLGYIDSELPADFVGASEAKSGLMKYLQFLRLADALIFGAALAMPKSPRQDPK